MKDKEITYSVVDRRGVILMDRGGLESCLKLLRTQSIGALYRNTDSVLLAYRGPMPTGTRAARGG